MKDMSREEMKEWFESMKPPKLEIDKVQALNGEQRQEPRPVDALVMPTPKRGTEFYIWTVKREEDTGRRFIITPVFKKADELVESLLEEGEYIDICHSLAGQLEADIEVWV